MYGKELKNILESILNADSEKVKKDVKELEEALEQTKYDFHDADAYDTIFVYQIRKIIRGIADKHIGFEDTSGKAEFIYTNCNFVSSHIRKLLEMRTNGSCSADKTRTIISAYLKYLENPENKSIDFTKESFAYPKFGTTKEWFDLCDSLLYLYHGNPEKYFHNYSNLLKAEIRKYKHTQYDWYIVLTSGAELSIDSMYDEYSKDPLENEYLWSDDLFVVLKRNIPDDLKKYFVDLSNTECKDHLSYHKKFSMGLPKDKIKKSYCKKHEVYI